MSRYRELVILVSSTEYNRLQREAKSQSRTAGLQAKHYIRQGLGLAEPDTGPKTDNTTKNAANRQVAA